VNISKPFIERPVATTLLMAALFLIGVAAFPFLPIAPLPQIDFPTILVSATLPGASPEIMASSVAQPLETQFAQISGVSQMTSTSVLGSTQITLQFNLDRNIDAAAQDVQSAIDAAGGQLPKNLPAPPNLRKVNPADSAILILAVHSDVMPVTAVDDYAETVIAQQLSQLPGIAQVSVGGQQKPAVRVQIDPVRLAAVGLQLEDVANLITTATVDSPQGAITGAQKNFTIYDNDQLLKAAPWNDVIIAYRNGAPIRIKDVGVAVDGPENSQIRGFQNGKLGVLLLIYKQPGTNVIDAVNGVKAAMPHVMTSVPPSLKVDQVIDRTTTITASVKDVEFSLLIAIVLVVLVIFLFLRSFWATAIPAVTVPLSLLGTAALMYAIGYSLDNLSLMALTIAVGFVVDDAIVMLENIYRHIHQHLAGGGVHPAAADERHRGPAVPRIRGDRHHDYRGLGRGGPHPLADDVRAVPARRETRPARPLLPDPRAWLPVDGGSLHPWARLRAAPPARNACHLHHHSGDRRDHVRDRAQGLLPAAGHRDHRGTYGCARGRLVRRHAAPGGQPHRRARQGPGGRELGRVRRRLAAAEQRLCDPGTEAARSARRHRRPDHRPPAQEDRRRPRRHGVPAGRAGPERGRTPVAHAVPVHAAGSQSR
jgi:hypothetical protein